MAHVPHGLGHSFKVFLRGRAQGVGLEQGGSTSAISSTTPPLPSGRGVGFLFRRLRVRIPQEVDGGLLAFRHRCRDASADSSAGTQMTQTLKKHFALLQPQQQFEINGALAAARASFLRIYPL